MNGHVTSWPKTLLSRTAAIALWMLGLSGLPAMATSEPQAVSDTPELAPGSFAHVAMKNMRSAVGMSFGVFESYSSTVNVADTSSIRALRFSSLQPTLYLRNRREKSDLDIMYSFGFGVYQGERRVSAASHAATLGFSRRLSRRITLGLTDTMSSGLNDYGVSIGPRPLPNDASRFVQDFDVRRQRITQNSAGATLSFKLSSKSDLSFSGGHEIWRYSSGQISGSEGFLVGVKSAYRVNKWLYLNNSYFTYINKVSERGQASNIHRLELGGLEFHPTRTVQIYVSGGAEATTYTGRRQIGGSARAGIAKRSKSTLLDLGYSRGFSGAVGTADVFSTHDVAASYTQWLTRRFSFRVQSRYSTGSSRSGGVLDYVLGTAEVAFATTNHSVLSLEYSYLSQQLSNVAVGSPRSNRYWARAGFQVFLPSLSIR
jgi:hypothetical protein